MHLPCPTLISGIFESEGIDIRFQTMSLTMPLMNLWPNLTQDKRDRFLTNEKKLSCC